MISRNCCLTLEVKDTSDTQKYAYLQIYNGRELKIKAYDKRDEFTFLIINYPFVSNYIRAAPEYGVYI